MASTLENTILVDSEDIADVTVSQAGLRPADVAGLSSEARLATALVLQSQALDGMRRAQSDLLRRVDEGGGEGLAEELGGVAAAVDNVAGVQKKMAKEVRAIRRRTRRSVAVALLLLMGGIGVAGWWVDQRLAARLQHEQAGPWGLPLGPAGGGRLDEVQAELETARAQLAEERDGRIRGLGEQDRLRTELVSQQAALWELRGLVPDARPTPSPSAAVEGGDGRIRESNSELRRTDPAMLTQVSLEQRVNDALNRSGNSTRRVAEVGEQRDGVLHEVLFIDPLFPSSAILAERAWLEIQAGRARLMASGGGDDGSPLELPLPDFDEDAWLAAGLTVPRAAVLGNVVAALDVLVARHGYHVVSVDSVIDGELRGLVLEEEDMRGGRLRTLRADVARLDPVGPELVLEHGTVMVGEVKRPFFRDVFRLALPGADLTPWETAVRAEPR